MRISATAIGLFFGIVVSVLLWMLVSEVRSNRSYHQEMASLYSSLHDSKATNELLMEKLNTLASNNEAAPPIQAGETDSVAAEAAVEEAELPVMGDSNSYVVKAYLGDQYLGTAVMYQRNVATDPETGKVTFEPLLILDPSLKNKFTKVETKLVEREVVRNNSNYEVNSVQVSAVASGGYLHGQRFPVRRPFVRRPFVRPPNRLPAAGDDNKKVPLPAYPNVSPSPLNSPWGQPPPSPLVVPRSSANLNALTHPTRTSIPRIIPAAP